MLADDLHTVKTPQKDLQALCKNSAYEPMCVGMYTSGMDSGSFQFGTSDPHCVREAPTARPGQCQLQARQQKTEIDLPGWSWQAKKIPLIDNQEGRAKVLVTENFR